jgi:hypothetical protein
LSDGISTFSSGYERFKRELGRAKKDGGYLIILIEENFNNFRSFEYLPQTKHSKCTVDFISKRIRSLYEEFNCFQLCFSNGRVHAAKIIEFILKTNKKIKTIDIQLLIDKKVL